MSETSDVAEDEGIWPCPLGHEHHETDEEESCNEGTCARDPLDVEYARCGYIFFSGAWDEDGYALWTDQHHTGTKENNCWSFCPGCHEEMFLRSVEGSL